MHALNYRANRMQSNLFELQFICLENVYFLQFICLENVYFRRFICLDNFISIIFVAEIQQITKFYVLQENYR